MRVLITGATGFIGRATALRLAAEGIAIRALIRPGHDTDAFERAGIQLAHGDVHDPRSVRDAMRGCTHVLHLAAATAARGVTRRTFHAVNVAGTRTVIEAARSAGIVRLVYGSTLGVHGFVTRGVLDETTPVRPNTPYRTSKWMGELAVRDAQATFGLPAVIARISTVVGDGANGWRPLVQGIATGRMRLPGDGANHVDLLAIDDLIDGLWRCVSTPGIEGDCFALARGEAATLRQFSEMIAHALNVRVPAKGPPAGVHKALVRAGSELYRLTGFNWVYAHSREVLVADRRASIAHARAVLGFDPKSSIASAVEAMVARYVANG